MLISIIVYLTQLLLPYTIPILLFVDEMMKMNET